MDRFINNQNLSWRDGTVEKSMYCLTVGLGSVPSNTGKFKTILTLGPGYLTLSSNSVATAFTCTNRQKDTYMFLHTIFLKIKI